MRKKIILLFLSSVLFCSSAAAYESHRDYVSSQDLIITDQGIFLKKGSEMVPVESISYDYSAGNFYATATREEILLVTCPRCGQKTYSPKLEICFNSKCQRAWSLHR